VPDDAEIDGIRLIDCTHNVSIAMPIIYVVLWRTTAFGGPELPDFSPWFLPWPWSSGEKNSTPPFHSNVASLF
jgi:hypothetical protein